MNIFKWIAGRTGKASLLQMVGLGAVGVAGAAAVGSFLLSGSPADNTAFSPAQYNPGEVVYVAGANTGSYGSGAYSMDGSPESSLQVSANTIKRIERQTMAEKAAEEMAGEALPDDQVVPTDPKAYQMGSTEGLGMAGNAAREEELKKNPMGALGGMPDISGMIAQATQAAQGGAAKEAQQQAGGQTAAALASAQKNWSGGAGGASGGHAFNSSFAIQDSGKNGGAPGAAAPGAADAVAAAKTQMSRTMESARMRANAAVFGSGDDKLAQSRESTLGDYRSSKEGKDLEYIRKRSADAASNKNRAANEGARAFLASNRISGGMTITGDSVSTGQGQGSADFNNSAETSLRGIGSWAQEQTTFNMERKKFRDELRIWMWVAIPVTLAAIMAMVAAIAAGGWFFGSGYIAAAVFAAIALVPVLGLLARSIQYGNQYEYDSLAKWGIGVACACIAGIGAAFIPGIVGGAAKWKTAGIITRILIAAGLGTGVAALLTKGGMTDDPTLDDPDYSNPYNKE